MCSSETCCLLRRTTVTPAAALVIFHGYYTCSLHYHRFFLHSNRIHNEQREQRQIKSEIVGVALNFLLFFSFFFSVAEFPDTADSCPHTAPSGHVTNQGPNRCRLLKTGLPDEQDIVSPAVMDEM